jgi:hypothetical protein
MTAKTDIKKILSKGSLTGKEAGKLILQDNWDADHNREGVLSDREISSIKASLKTTQDQEEYNCLVDLYRIADFTLKEAHILELEAESKLFMSTELIRMYNLEDEVRGIQAVYLPAIVTQKQYEDLKAKQKASKLKTINTLSQTLERRAMRLASDDIRGEWENGDYEYLVAFLRESHPDLWKQTLSEILEVIKAGKLKPVQISNEETKVIVSLWQEIRDTRIDYQEAMSADAKRSKTKLGDLETKESNLLQKYYETNKKKDNQAVIISSLEKLLDGSLAGEEEDKILEYTFCSVEDLVLAGLPEWIHEVETFYPGLDEDSEARPTGMIGASQIAIIQDPSPYDLDERGYWKARECEALNRLSGYEYRQQKKGKTGDIFDIPETLKGLHYLASERIKAFLAIQAVIEAISKTVGVNFSDDMEEWYTSLYSVVQLYNSYLYINDLRSSGYLGMPKLDHLKIGRLKPTTKSVNYYLDRMAIALGQDWLKQTQKNGWRMKDLMAPLEFKELEQGSLAQEMIKDMTNYNIDSEEASNGKED